MHDPRIDQLARTLVRYSTQVKKGDFVWIDCFDVPNYVAQAMIRAVVEAKAHPLIHIHDTAVTREMMLHAADDQYDLIGTHNLELMKKMDCYIAVRGSNNITENSDVPAEKMKMVMAKLRPLQNERVNNTRWCVLRWPTSAMAQQAGMSTQAFEDFYYKVCLLDYAALDVWHLPALRDLLTRELAALDRLDWLDQQCRRQIESGLSGFPRDEETAWRVGPCDRLRGRGLSALHAVWHWREKWAEEIDTPPFKVCSNDVLFQMAQAAEQGDAIETILATTNLGKRQSRLAPSLAAALREGFSRDPSTLPRRPRAERIHLTQAEIERQDRIKSHRDQVAARLNLDPTLIAPRSTLVTLCREPGLLDEILLPWQADLLRDAPDLSPAVAPAPVP